jgi:hypothetical protein
MAELYVALGRGVKPGQGSGVLAELYVALGRGMKYFDRQAGRQAGPSIEVLRQAGRAVD